MGGLGGEAPTRNQPRPGAPLGGQPPTTSEARQGQHDQDTATPQTPKDKTGAQNFNFFQGGAPGLPGGAAAETARPPQGPAR